MTDVTEQDVTRLATASTGWHEATRGANCDAWLAAGNDLDDAVTRLLNRARRTKPAAPTFPYAIANPYELYVQLQPGSPGAAQSDQGRVPIGCTSLEHAEAMFTEETLTRGFPWWVQVVMVERSEGGRPARVVAQKTRDLTVTTWRRDTPSY